MPASVHAQPVRSDGKISIAAANDFAQQLTARRDDQQMVARNLLLFPPGIMVRGIFFEGLSRIVAETHGPSAMAELLARAGIGAKTTAFRSYPHRDFYKLYYLSACLLHPRAPMAEALRLVARTFFPIFKSSLLGRTMSALMGERPATLLPLLARAYNLSVEGNEHHAELAGERALLWRCEVEPVEWYTETFSGIVEGAIPPDLTVNVNVEERSAQAGRARYHFRITW